MERPAQNTRPRMGVRYARSQYAGLARRCVVLIIDLIVVLVAWVVIGAFWFSVFANASGLSELMFFLNMVGFAFLYLIVLERSKFGTLGFRLCGVKIVDQHGHPPSLLSMMLRQTSWVFWPFNPILDFMWLSGDARRQSLRDKLTNTYVVRRNAVPIGSGKIQTVYYDIFGFSFFFREIQEAESRMPSERWELNREP